MKSMLWLMRASLTGFARDRAALVWTLVFPIALLAVFGTVFAGGSGSPSYNVAWVDGAHTAASAAVRSGLDQSGAVHVADEDLETGLGDMRAGRVRAVVEAPAGFGSDAAARIRVRIDPSDRSTSGAIVAIVDRVLAEATSSGPQGGGVDVVPIQDRPLSAAAYFVPTILAMALMQLGIYAAVTLVQQRERQVLKRFASAPIERWSIIGSFVGGRLVVAVVQAILFIVAARFVVGLDVPINVVALAPLVLLTAATFIAIGFVIAGIARTEEAATQITGLVSLPLMFLSGVFIPVEQLPDVVRPVAAAMPLTYAADALRQVMVNGTPFVPITVAIAVLLGWLGVSLLAAVRLFRWQ